MNDYEKCPKCKEKMNWFTGNEGMPDGFYCPVCNDAIYSEKGQILCLLE